jgi:uncharacterized protein (DUF3084 family)
MRGAEDVKYIAQALNGPIVRIENSRNNISQQEEILRNRGGKEEKLSTSLEALERAKQPDAEQIAQKTTNLKNQRSKLLPHESRLMVYNMAERLLGFAKQMAM